MFCSKGTVLLSVLAIAFPAAARDISISSPQVLTAALPAVRPGDTLILTDGQYQDAEFVFKAGGAEAKPVTLRPATPGGAIFTGKSSLRVTGQYLLVDGLKFEGTTVAPLFLESASHCRVTNVAIIRCNPPDESRYHWLHIGGANSDANRVDHCYFEGKTKSGVVLVVDGHAGTNRMNVDNVIDHNEFKDIVKAVNNGMEAIRIGTSAFSQQEARAVIEDNLFENASGDAEIISSKTCGNIVRHNTFINCEGAVVMRHGHRGLIEGNIFLGQGNKRAGGVRLHGTGHRVIGNYFSDLGLFNIALPVGQHNFVATGWEPVIDATITSNIFVQPAGPVFQFGLDPAGTARKNDPALQPRETFADASFENNTVTGGPLPLFDDRGHGTLRWTRNVLYAATPETANFPPTPGITVASPPPIEVAAVRLKPLSPKDVGPAWMAGG